MLKVGALTESVNVEAQAQVLNTDRATISETIGERAIVELPLSGATSGAWRARRPASWPGSTATSA